MRVWPAAAALHRPIPPAIADGGCDAPAARAQVCLSGRTKCNCIFYCDNVIID
jgi:hypothetical protein